MKNTVEPIIGLTKIAKLFTLPVKQRISFYSNKGDNNMFSKFISQAKGLMEKAQDLVKMVSYKNGTRDTTYVLYCDMVLRDSVDKLAESLMLVNINLDQCINNSSIKNTCFSMPQKNVPLILWLDNGLVVEGSFNTDENDKAYFEFNTGWLPRHSCNTLNMKKVKSSERVKVLKWAYLIPPVELDKKWEEKLNGYSSNK